MTAMHALAANPITLKSTVEIEQLVTQPDGTVVKTLKPFKSAAPGQEVVFSNTMTNTSKRAADNLVLVNPVPVNMKLTQVWGDNAVIDFSLDGKKFAAPELLQVKTEQGLRQATMNDYKSIRWTLKTLTVGQTAKVGFNAVIQ
jgi:uncharacterized repeat protein (TIGR01451 family)